MCSHLVTERTWTVAGSPNQKRAALLADSHKSFCVRWLEAQLANEMREGGLLRPESSIGSGCKQQFCVLMTWLAELCDRFLPAS